MVRIGHASLNELGHTTGGQKGDQKNEVCIRSWYNKSWSYLLRPKNSNKAEIMATNCEIICNNPACGYDQSTRNSLHQEAIKTNFDFTKIGLCNCDCSSFMTVCAESAGISIPYQYGNAPTTSTMKTAFMSTGEFDLYIDTIYLNNPNFLKRGDILVKENSHTVMVLDNGIFCNNIKNENLVIDLSENQGKVDFSKVKTDKVTKVILRSTKKNNIVDNKFKEYLSQCDKNNIPVECYKYSYALTFQDAIEEATSVINLLNGRKMRIWLDLEENTQTTVLGKIGILNIANAFLNTCEKAGYEVGIYCNLSWYNNYIDNSLKQKYKFWIARYGENNGSKNEQYRPTVGQIGWQYTSKGSISGIKGFVDLSVFNDTSNVNTSVNKPNNPIKNDININSTVNASSLNVRRYPNITSPILYKLKRNEKVAIYGYVTDWYTINKELTEWVSKDYIVTTKGKVTATKLNYRQDVGINSKLLGQYNKGDIVNILNSKKNENSTWYLCLGSNDKFGWVSGDYISPV